jgi:hypothetical protein
MSGYTDSAKFNSNASYYVEASPFSGGETVAGNLTVAGNVTVGQDLQVTGDIVGPVSVDGNLAVAGVGVFASNISCQNITASGALQGNSGLITNLLNVGSIQSGPITASTGTFSGQVGAVTLAASGNANVNGATITSSLRGAWNGNAIPTSSGGQPTTTATADIAGQYVDFTIGNTRIKSGYITAGAAVTDVGVVFSGNAFSGRPIIQIQLATNAPGSVGGAAVYAITAAGFAILRAATVLDVGYFYTAIGLA